MLKIVFIIFFVIFTLINPAIGSWLFIGAITLQSVHIFVANSRLKIPLRENHPFSSKEKEMLEDYPLFFRYPSASMNLSSVMSGVQVSIFILCPYLLFRGFWIEGLIIGAYYFVASILAVTLNPLLFFSEKVKKGGTEKEREDLQVCTSIIEKLSK